MYYPYFLTYILTGFGLSLAVFLWALNRGQFRDQQRARFLPLEKNDPHRSAPSAIGRLEAYGLFTLALIGLGTSASMLLFALFSNH